MPRWPCPNCRCSASSNYATMHGSLSNFSGTQILCPCSSSCPINEHHRNIPFQDLPSVTTSGTGVPWCGNSLGLFPWSQDGHLPDYLYVYMFWRPRLNVIDDDTLYVLLWNIYVPEMCISLVNVEWNGIDRCMVRCWAMQWSLYSIAIKVGLWSKDSWTGIVRT
jgi:hypothetical protein